MIPSLAGREAGSGAVGATRYERHRPEQTLLYQIVEEHYPAFLTQFAAQDKGGFPTAATLALGAPSSHHLGQRCPTCLLGP